MPRELCYCGQIYQFDRVLVGQFPVANKHLTIADSVAGFMTPVSQVTKVDGPVLIEVVGTRRIIALGNTSIVCVVNDNRPCSSPVRSTRRQARRPRNSVRRIKARSGRSRNFVQRAVSGVAQILLVVGPLFA
jgi:hypothetical protein